MQMSLPPYLCLDQKLAFAHDQLVIDPDVEFPADDVDVSGGVPVGAGMSAVGIAKCDVDAGILLVLQDLSDDVLEIDIGADGKLADAIAVGIGVRVLPEVV